MHLCQRQFLKTTRKQVHEKLLTITNHQGNSNQNQNELSPHSGKNGYYKKEQRQQNVKIKQSKKTNMEEVQMAK
jgi:hypothetical protein